MKQYKRNTFVGVIVGVEEYGEDIIVIWRVLLPGSKKPKTLTTTGAPVAAAVGAKCQVAWERNARGFWAHTSVIEERQIVSHQDNDGARAQLEVQ